MTDAEVDIVIGTAHRAALMAYRRVMASRNMLFRAMYRVGFTPWDGHPQPKSLHDLVEGNDSHALPAATALDIGCGTGDTSIYLAQHGWQVTGVDFAEGAGQGASPPGLRQLRSSRCHPPQFGPGRGDRVYVDRRRRLLA